jgi:hypothetical protein
MPVKEREGTDKVTTGTVPIPASGTVCGDPAALSLRFSVAERAPAAPGVNVSDTAQLAAGASEELHVFVSAKSDAFAPLMEMLLNVRLAVPELVTVNICTPDSTPTG